VEFANLQIGTALPSKFWKMNSAERQAILSDIRNAGLDHVFVGDHISFVDGSGSDGLMEIAALAGMQPALRFVLGVYLLPLRHPVIVARQLATLAQIAPGRVLFGIGVGGEDPHEFEMCGVNPTTRGLRTDEGLALIKGLSTGRATSMEGRFFSVSEAVIKPPVKPAIPLLVGGRSNAALTRTARFADGWLASWCSPGRFSEATRQISDQAEAFGRTAVEWTHGYQPWIGVADTRAKARELVGDAMERFYKIPFSRFEKYTPVGRPEEVAEMLSAHREAGCTLFNLKVVCESHRDSIEACAEIARRLRTN